MSMTCISTQKPDVWACPICTEDGSSCGTVKSHCGHEVCLCCWSELRSRSSTPKCPLCRAFYRFQTKTPQEANTVDHIAEPANSVNPGDQLLQLLLGRNSALTKCFGCDTEKDDVKCRMGNYLFGGVVTRIELMRCVSCAQAANSEPI
jgi:hypothetical protein